jgi:hypothetical protein
MFRELELRPKAASEYHQIIRRGQTDGLHYFKFRFVDHPLIDPGSPYLGSCVVDTASVGPPDNEMASRSKI